MKHRFRNLLKVTQLVSARVAFEPRLFGCNSRMCALKHYVTNSRVLFMAREGRGLELDPKEM